MGSPRRDLLALVPLALLAGVACAPLRVGTAPVVASAPADGRFWPGETWERVAAPRELGWSPEKLAIARAQAATLHTAAVVVVVGGKVLDEWGQTATRYNLHSMRKSLLSALYGVHVRAGRVDLTRTLAQLGIDDNEPSLDAAEKQATVGDLLRARSGVYHPALYETAAMKAARPPRHSHPPGTFWYYNNWDFNALGTILERAARNSVFREFEERIALPTQMQDYRVEDGSYVTGPDSVYPAYPFRMSARDLARFGLLFLRHGAWRDRQLIPADWVAESTTAWSEVGSSGFAAGAGGYGYLWWVAVRGQHFPGVTLPEGSYSARGAGGHFVVVIPAYDLVLVHRVDTDVEGQAVSVTDFARLLELVLEAREGR